MFIKVYYPEFIWQMYIIVCGYKRLSTFSNREWSRFESMWYNNVKYTDGFRKYFSSVG